MEKNIKYILSFLNKNFPLNKNQIKTELYYPKKNKYALLIALILSASTTDKQVNNVTPELFSIADNPFNMIKLGKQNIYKLIKKVGLSKKKSSYIFELSKIIIEKSKFPITKEKLIELPGVGNKIAGVFIINAKLFDKNIKEFDFPVDTHVKQFALKHKLTKNKNPNKISEDLKQLFPQKKWAKLHYQMIAANRSYK